MGFIGPFCQLLWSRAQGPGNNLDNVTNLKVNANKMLGKSFYVSCLINQIVLRPGSVQNKLKVSFLRSLKSLNNLFCPEVYKNCE